MASRIQFKRGTAAQWTAANPVLTAGEVGLETDTRYFKFGDGTTAWTSLLYFNHADLAAATTAATASTIARRDGSGTLLATEMYVTASQPASTNSLTRKDYVDTQVATRVSSAITISAGTGLTGGGDLSANRTLTVSYGSASGTAVEGNDARVTADQVAGTASIRTLGTGAQQAAAGNHTHTATGISDSTAIGRSILTAADAAAVRTAISAAAATHTHVATTDLTATGTKNSTTFLRGDDTWAIPGGAADASETVKGIVELATAAETTTGTDNTRAVHPAGLKVELDKKIASFTDPNADRIVFWDDSASAYAALAHSAPVNITGTSLTVDASTETAAGAVELATAAETTTGTDNTRAVHPAGLKVELDKKAVNTITISAGTGLTGGGDLTANRTLTVSYGSASGTAVQGNDARVTADQAAGTASIRTIGTGALQAAAGNHTHTSKDITNPSVALTDGATIATDASLGRMFRVSIAGNRTLLSPTNAVDGMRIIYEITASAADRTLTLTTGSSGAFAYGTDFTSIPTITSGTTAFIGCMYSTRSSRWHVLAVGVGHA